jgi:ABC-type multidrug transport system ATPase subunit
MYSCPPGYFCPSGTIQPRKCDLLSICGGGNITQKSLVGLLTCLILDMVLMLLIWWKKLSFRRQNKQNLLTKSEHVEDELLSNFVKSLDDKRPKMNIRIERIHYALPSGKVVLQDISGEFHSGRMCAIMGGSGSGKTTLLDVILGKRARSMGRIFVSGIEVELSRFKNVYGYVPQEDIMYRELTVRENLLHSARIRLPRSWTSCEIEKHVDVILKTLNLYHVAHTVIGDETTYGISGGQRKRVNIGLELVALPLCLVLDEPTSGLDATAALEIIEILGKIARLGTTVIAVVHQPRVEIFREFDDVLMLTPNGKMAYFGMASMARVYYEELGFQFVDGSNEADVMMDILSGKGICDKKYSYEELTDIWALRFGPKSSMATRNTIRSVSDSVSNQFVLQVSENDKEDRLFHELVPKIMGERGSSLFAQFWYCHNLALLQQFRALSGLVLEVFVGAAAGVLMGVAVNSVPELYTGMLKKPYTLLSPSPFYWPIPQYGLLIGLAVALAASPSGVKVFGEEIPVYWRQASAGHSKVAYFLGKTVASLYRIFLAGLHFASVLYFLAAPVIPFWVQFAMITLLFYCVFGLASFVSMVVKRENATLLAVVVALFSAVFCGYGPTLADVKKWRLYFLWAISFNMWASQAQFSETLAVYDHVYDSELSNIPFGYDLNQSMFDFAMMAVIGTVWRLLAFIAMISLNRNRQR